MTSHLELLAAEQTRIEQKRRAIQIAKRKLLLRFPIQVVMAELQAEQIFDYALERRT
jgi:hypothetical protein